MFTLFIFFVLIPDWDLDQHLCCWDGTVFHIWSPKYFLDCAHTCAYLSVEFLLVVCFIWVPWAPAQILLTSLVDSERTGVKELQTERGKTWRWGSENMCEKDLKSTQTHAWIQTLTAPNTWIKMFNSHGKKRSHWRQLWVKSLRYLNPNIPSASAQDGGRQGEENLSLLFVNMHDQRNLSYESYGLGTVYTCMQTHTNTPYEYTHWWQCSANNPPLLGCQFSPWACTCLTAFLFMFVSE